LVEGAAGVALAGATRFADMNPGTRVVAVSCGANVGAASLEAMLVMANR
jgi:threonine dehydratase